MGDSDLLKSDVFHRTQADGPVVSDATYNTVIGMVLCWGFFINWLIVQYIDTASLLEIGLVVFLIGYFASCFFGVYLFNTSKDPSISFLGYNFVVVPFGLVLDIVISRYPTRPIRIIVPFAACGSADFAKETGIRIE